MPNDAAPVLDRSLVLDRFLPYRLSVLTNRVSDAIARLYSERLSLSVPEWRVMAVLGECSGLSSVEVGRRTAMHKVQVSRAVAGLVAARRVQRVADAEDARISRLSLTARGRAVYDEIVPLALHLEDTLISALSKDDLAQLSRLMAKLDKQVSRLAAPDDCL
ncbi:MAG: winged helix-turn-helix transcriptional regulator [Alphaproteobacteria bacterium]|jgi:DNA-binding MarR family transcriptional regulator|nr:winged helix-turn-helix transcriptional regulator [Alphaproteobacteria bacterium]